MSYCLSMRAQPIKFSWANTDAANIFVLLKLQVKCISAFFTSEYAGHIDKRNNHTSYIYEIAGCHCDTLGTISVCFASWGKIYTPGAILLSVKHHCLNWSHDKFEIHDFLSWLWCLCNGQVLSWFQCWQAVSSLLFALCELQAKPKPVVPKLFWCICHFGTCHSSHIELSFLSCSAS